MSGLSGTGAGLSSDPGPSELDVIYQGGQFFLERMRAMDAQRQAAAMALADLALGQDAASAQRAAHEALTDAQAKLAAAEKSLSDATSQAAEMIADAKAEAKETVDSANANADALNTAAGSTKKEADDYAAKAKAEADETLAAANKIMSDVTAKSLALEVAKREADEAKAKSQQSWTAALAAKASHDKRIAEVSARISAISAVIAQPVT